MTASKPQSIALGVGTYVVLSLATSFLYFNGGTAMASLSGALACVVMLTAPVVAVWHYASTNALTVPPGPGAGMGAIAATIGAVLATLIQWGLQQAGVFPSTDEMLGRQRDQMIEQGMSPEEVDGMMDVIGGMSESLVNQIGSAALMGLVVGAIAGAIAAVVFKKGPDAEAVL